MKRWLGSVDGWLTSHDAALTRLGALLILLAAVWFGGSSLARL